MNKFGTVTVQYRYFQPKELLVLDSKRSNQINIGIKNLPRIKDLKSAILKMDDRSMTRENVEKLQAFTQPCKKFFKNIPFKKFSFRNF